MDVKVSKSSNPRTQSRSVKTPYTCNARVYVNADGLIRLRTRSTYTCTLHQVESILYLNVAMDECGCEYDDHFYMRSTLLLYFFSNCSWSTCVVGKQKQASKWDTKYASGSKEDRWMCRSTKKAHVVYRCVCVRVCGHDGSPDSQVLFFSFPPAGHSLDPNAIPHVQSCHDATVMMMT